MVDVTSRTWSTCRLDDLEPGERRVPVRRHFGIAAFGVNAWRGAKPGDRVIDAHNEVIERHEELYVVLSGRATFTLAGAEVDAPTGTLVFVPAATERGAVAADPDTVVLAIGAEPGQPFSPSAWEEWDELGIADLYGAGRYDEAAERFRTALERHPDHAGVHYNLACLLSLAGRHQEALTHIRRAAELEPRCAEWARSDSDFDPIRDDPSFPAA
jgi:tetratricopeptide (TPR) repeat protein